MGTGKSITAGQVWTRLQHGAVSKGDIVLVQLFEHDTEGYDILSTVRQAFKSRSPHLAVPPSMRWLENWLKQKLHVGNPVFVTLDALDKIENLN